MNIEIRLLKIPCKVITPIIFIKENTKDVAYSHDDALVTTIRIISKDVAKILVDIGNLVNILFKSTFDKLRLVAARTQRVLTPFNGITRDQVMP